MYDSCYTNRTKWAAQKRRREAAGNETCMHNADWFFVDRVTAPEFATVPPEEAELFVVPALCSQSYDDTCGRGHEHNAQQLADYLDASPWFARYGTLKLLNCTHPKHSNTVHLPKCMIFDEIFAF